MTVIRWELFLQDRPFRIGAIKGSENQGADFMSLMDRDVE